MRIRISKRIIMEEECSEEYEEECECCCEEGGRRGSIDDWLDDALNGYGLI